MPSFLSHTANDSPHIFPSYTNITSAKRSDTDLFHSRSIINDGGYLGEPLLLPNKLQAWQIPHSCSPTRIYSLSFEDRIPIWKQALHTLILLKYLHEMFIEPLLLMPCVPGTLQIWHPVFWRLGTRRQLELTCWRWSWRFLDSVPVYI